MELVPDKILQLLVSREEVNPLPPVSPKDGPDRSIGVLADLVAVEFAAIA